jgi:putative PIN family toxin of toxin-antitoxin system
VALRAVPDANLLISAVINPRGTPGRIVVAAAQGRCALVASPHLLSEVEEVLGREALRRWVTPDEARRFLTELDSLVELVPDAPRPWAAVTRDPGDDYLVALARAAGADALVSGDRDLTSLVGLVPPVMTPAAFLAMVEEPEQSGRMR